MWQIAVRYSRPNGPNIAPRSEHIYVMEDLKWFFALDIKIVSLWDVKPCSLRGSHVLLKYCLL
jgi:hypothetical protein